MKKPAGSKPKLAACTPDDVFKAINKLGGFEILIKSAKHTKVRHIESGVAFMIPRHTPVNKHLLRAFVKDVLIAQLGYTEEEIYKHLWC